MKLRRGRAVYKVPPYSQILCAYVEGNQRHNQMVSYMLQQVDLGDLASVGDDERRKIPMAMPTTFAVFDEKIEFWPRPDKAYKVTVRYLPPMMEF